jgi:hypothetical protein
MFVTAQRVDDYRDFAMKNRDGVEYHFEPVGENTYTITGDLKYWRYGGREGQTEVNFDNLGFVDPAGGPFIELGMKIADRAIVRISVRNDQILFDLAK